MNLDINKLLAEPSKAIEVEVPAQRETFEAQVLVMTRSYKTMEYPGLSVKGMTMPFPMEQTRRVLQAGKYHVELVLSSSVNGKPMLIIYEEE